LTSFIAFEATWSGCSNACVVGITSSGFDVAFPKWLYSDDQMMNTIALTDELIWPALPAMPAKQFSRSGLFEPVPNTGPCLRG
jgi:hypothetical protein